MYFMDINFSWKHLIVILSVLYMLIILFTLIFSDKIIFPYHQSSYDQNTSGLSLVPTQDNELLATRFWLADKEEYLVLYFHGNYEDLGHLDYIAGELGKVGLSMLSMDYRGYGMSTGKVSEETHYKDAALLYNLAIKMGHTAEKIIILGRSVGSGMAVNLAYDKKSVALVLVSPFISAFRVVTRIPLIPFDKYNNLDKIADIQQPLFVIHGASDNVIGSWHGKKLFDAHVGRKQLRIIPQAGHNDLWSYDVDSVLKQIVTFIKNEN